MTWLWGCMVLAFKASVGIICWSVVALIVAGALGAIAYAFTPKAKPEEKKPEDWKEWADEQDGELKTLLTEIDKDLKNE